jgi:hypothetical protein
MELNSLEKKIFFKQAVSALLELEQNHLSTAFMRILIVTLFLPYESKPIHQEILLSFSFNVSLLFTFMAFFPSHILSEQIPFDCSLYI